MSATGKCLCGNVAYRLERTPLKLDVCHCKNCQRQAGAAFIPFVAVPLNDVEISGSPKVFMDDDTVSGNTVARHFCGDCGSHLYVVVARAPKTAYVTSGTLDHTDPWHPNAMGGPVPNTSGSPFLMARLSTIKTRDWSLKEYELSLWRLMQAREITHVDGRVFRTPMTKHC